MRDRLQALFMPGQGRPARPWHRARQIARAGFLAGLVYFSSVVALAVPAYLSGKVNVEMTYEVVSGPGRDSFHIDTDQTGFPTLEYIRCEPEDSYLGDAGRPLLKCRYTTDELAPAEQFLEQQGFELGNTFRNVSITPAMGGWNLVLTALMAGIGWAIWLVTGGRSLADDMSRAWTFLSTRGHLALLPFAATYATSAFVLYVLGTPAPGPPRLPIDKLATIVLMTMVIAPVFEEVVFRGLIHDALRTALPWWIAAVPGSLWFSFMHTMPAGFSVAGYLSIAVFGFLLCWLREISSSLALCVLLHSLYNAIVILVTLATQ